MPEALPAVIEQDDLLSQLSEEHRTLVEAGVYTVFEGQDYPVLRWAFGNKKGQYVEGTGLPVNHVDLGLISKRTGIKRTQEYKALMERLIPPDADSKKYGSFGWLINQGFVAAEGVDVVKAVTCPSCSVEFSVKMFKRPDGNALIKLIEMMVGRASEQKEINIRAEQIYRLLDEQQNVKTIEVFEIDPSERARRKSRAEIIEGIVEEVVESD